MAHLPESAILGEPRVLVGEIVGRVGQGQAVGKMIQRHCVYLLTVRGSNQLGSINQAISEQ